jgi:hypothetical protein
MRRDRFVSSNLGQPGTTSRWGRIWTHLGRGYGDEVTETLPADVAFVLEAVLGEEPLWVIVGRSSENVGYLRADCRP